MGTEESKEELINDIGVNMKDMKRFLKTNVSDIQCLYLINVGKVNELREKYNIADNIDNNYIICKYGRSDDLIED